MYTQRYKRGAQDVSLRAGACVSLTSACLFKDAYRPLLRKLCTELCTDLTGPGWIPDVRKRRQSAPFRSRLHLTWQTFKTSTAS